MRTSVRRGAQLLIVCAVVAGATRALAERRLVSLGGAVTETVYALGEDKSLVGVDSSSIYPEAATRLPQVGYLRQLSAEGILALRPTLVLASAEAGPPAVLEQLRAAGATLVLIPAENTLAGATAKLEAIAQALKAEARGAALVRTLKAEYARAQARVAQVSARPRVLFIYARGGGTLLVSGSHTAADEMIRLAGGDNAVTGYPGFRPLTAEAAVAAAPDLLLVPQHGLDSVGGEEGLWKLPGLLLTPAGKRRRVVPFDDLLLLGFGPRTGQAIEALCALLHPPGDVVKRSQP